MNEWMNEWMSEWINNVRLLLLKNWKSSREYVEFQKRTPMKIRLKIPHHLGHLVGTYYVCRTVMGTEERDIKLNKTQSLPSRTYKLSVIYMYI